MATAAELTAQLARIDALMLRPKSVALGDRSETQHSMAELTARRDQILAELGRANTRRRQFFAYSSKGLT